MNNKQELKLNLEGYIEFWHLSENKLNQIKTDMQNLKLLHDQ